jgi:ACS family tartrate transporter-like MFS transporter
MTGLSALDRARGKAFARLIPWLFIAYVIAFVDRVNVGIATLTMSKDMPAFNEEVIAFGAGVFFVGYLLLEIPGALIVERWGARRWISRIMVTWGLMAALTAFVKVPWHFYVVRFLLGLAEAGFFPGVVVYLTHWFPSRDRAKALASFYIAVPVAQLISPKLSYQVLKIGAEGRPEVWGLEGWQWLYIAWGIPAVVLAPIILYLLPDRPAHASWLKNDEREALEARLREEHAAQEIAGIPRMSVLQAFRQRRVLLLTLAWFLTCSSGYAIAFFMPRILQAWYHQSLDDLTWTLVLPAVGLLVSLVFVGWNSDRTHERWIHSFVPIAVSAGALAVLAMIKAPPMGLAVSLFVLASCSSACLPAFFAIPNLFLRESAVAGSIGFINSIGALGGFLGPEILGTVKKSTGDFQPGLMILAAMASVSAMLVLGMSLADRASRAVASNG